MTRAAARAWFGAWLRESRSGLAVLATAAGVVTGCGALVFRWLITLFTRLFAGVADYSDAGHASHPWLRFAGPAFVVAVPVIAGLLYGPFVAICAPEARGHGVPEVLYALARRGGRIAGRIAVVKSMASALCIGGGGSLGREGPIVQIGAAVGSSLGRKADVELKRMRILLACGAAAGIAGTFNAPLTGIFFGAEMILRTFDAESCIMVTLASVLSTLISRIMLGDAPQLTVPGVTVGGPAEYVGFALLGLVAGAAGIGYTHLLCLAEDAGDKFWRGPEWLRPAVGGLPLGLMLLALPQMYGVGDPVQTSVTDGAYGIGFCLLLVVGKAAASSLTIGIGGSGGVFGPCLFIGAALGAAFGETLHLADPNGDTGSVILYALVGMGALFAGASRAPLTSVAIVFELTARSTVLLPLLAAVTAAGFVSRRLSRGTIYTIRLLRRGVDPEGIGPAPDRRPAPPGPAAVALAALTSATPSSPGESAVAAAP